MTADPQMIVSLISRIREKANRYISSELSSRGLSGLKPVHGDLLLALFRYDGPTMKELTDLVDRKKSTVTTLVEKLVRLGYVAKIRDDDDQRVFRIFLTQEGRALGPHLAEISSSLIAKVYKDMPREQRQVLVNLLSGINGNW